MYKWEKLGVSKEIFEVCEKLAKAGLSDEVKEKVEKCTVEKADMSELKCDSISKGDIESFVTIVGDDNGYSISTINKDSINLKVNSIDNKKIAFQEVMECVTSELSNDLWQTFEEAEDEEILCLECLVKYYLEKAYSEGFKSGLESIRNKMDDIENELLFEICESGYGD